MCLVQLPSKAIMDFNPKSQLDTGASLLEQPAHLSCSPLGEHQGGTQEVHGHFGPILTGVLECGSSQRLKHRNLALPRVAPQSQHSGCCSSDPASISTLQPHRLHPGERTVFRGCPTARGVIFDTEQHKYAGACPASCSQQKCPGQAVLYRGKGRRMWARLQGLEAARPVGQEAGDASA